MMSAWILLAFGYPMLAALGMLATRGAHTARHIMMLTAPLPALLLAVSHSSVVCEVPWLMMGARFGLTPVTRVFLLFTALLWFLAGWFSIAYMKEDDRARRFHFLFLMTLGANIGLIVARDAISFYALFAMMTFAAYGLVVHDHSPAARRAARIYLVMAIFGELMIISAIWLIACDADRMVFERIPAAVAGSACRDVIILLVLAGFGVKAGVLFLHMWLPMAHPVAPTPASAVLSGAMIKAGLLAWIQFLPAGELGAPGWSLACVTAGFATAFYGALAGFAQRDPKTILAYSSVSQMGVMLVGVGIGFHSAERWLPATTVLALYALNHGLAKGALFLGVGVAQGANRPALRLAVIMVLVFAALTIAGAPLTGGFLTKSAMKDVAYALPEQWTLRIHALLTLSSIATTLVLLRFLRVVWLGMVRNVDVHPVRGLWPAWIATAVAAMTWAWLAAAHVDWTYPIALHAWKSTWPVGLGALLFLGLMRLTMPAVPSGDVVVLLESTWRVMRGVVVEQAIPRFARLRIRRGRIMEVLKRREDRSDILSRWERSMERLERAGSLFVITMIVLFVLLWLDI